MKYAKYLPLALAAIDDAFKHNENKHGEGLAFRSEDMETLKCFSHYTRHQRGLVFSKVNHEDNCLHLTSAVCRALKALEVFLAENPNYVGMFTAKGPMGRLATQKDSGQLALPFVENY